MVFALSPSVIFDMLDYSVPKILLGKKECDPTLWRNLSEMKAGRTIKPQRKTEEQVMNLFAEKFHIANFADLIKQIPDGPAWKFFITSLNKGTSLGGGGSFIILEQEATRLERLAGPAREAIRLGDFQAAFKLIKRAQMPPLPCLQWIIEHIDSRGSMERFAFTGTPLIIATTLYLLACAEADFCDVGDGCNEKILPEMRNGKLIRPMTRWLEAVMVEHKLPTKRALADCLLAHQDKDNTRPEVNKWLYRGDIPAWSRVPTIVRSLSDTFGPDKHEEIQFKVIKALCMIRILDGLLLHSVVIRDQHLPEYDPLAPFRDYPLMLAHAQSTRSGLPTHKDL